jgi:hypothetical protein
MSVELGERGGELVRCHANTTTKESANTKLAVIPAPAGMTEKI